MEAQVKKKLQQRGVHDKRMSDKVVPFEPATSPTKLFLLNLPQVYLFRCGSFWEGAEKINHYRLHEDLHQCSYDCKLCLTRWALYRPPYQTSQTADIVSANIN